MTMDRGCIHGGSWWWVWTSLSIFSHDDIPFPLIHLSPCHVTTCKNDQLATCLIIEQPFFLPDSTLYKMSFLQQVFIHSFFHSPLSCDLGIIAFAGAPSPSAPPKPLSCSTVTLKTFPLNLCTCSASTQLLNDAKIHTAHCFSSLKVCLFSLFLLYTKQRSQSTHACTSTSAYVLVCITSLNFGVTGD